MKYLFDQPLSRGRFCRCLAWILGLLLPLSGCGAAGPAAVREIRRGAAVEAEAPGKGPYAAEALTKDSEPVAVAGLLELHLDEASQTVIVRETSSGTAWYTIGASANTPQSNTGACAVELSVVANGGRMTLNSQDHSVAFGRAEAQVLANGDAAYGLRVEYAMFPTAAAANKKELAKSDVAFLVTVDYLLRDGNFYIEADWRNLSGNPDAFIESLGLMERFGALRMPGVDDYLFLPDGCGALLYPARMDEGDERAKKPIRFEVYGQDPARVYPAEEDEAFFRGEDGEPLAAHVAAYGVKRGKTAFLAVVEQGASLASITARPFIAGEVRQSAVGPRFCVTPNTLGGDRSKALRADACFADAAEKDAGKIRICYRFLFGDNANYANMARACREELINSGILSSTKTVSPNPALPLHLTVLGAVPEGKRGLTPLSTLDQTLDLLTRLKGKGVDSLNIRCLGVFGGGLRQSGPDYLKPLPKLGGAAGLSALQEYCDSKTMDLFLDVNLLSARRQANRQAIDMRGQPLLRDPLQGAGGRYPGIVSAAGELPLRGAGNAGVAARSLLEGLRGHGVAGVSIGDMGRLLYADYAGAGFNREEAARSMAQTLPSLAAQWRIMLDGAYFHVIRSADVVVNLPLKTQLPVSEQYAAVPFLQMILHGSVDYSGAALNLAEEPDDAFLRTVEYGASPSFTWYCTDLGKEGDLYYFEPQMSFAVDAYTRANEALGDLRGQRIVLHSMPAAGVALTEYSGEVSVYVNYNDAPAIVDGFTIPARDFLRVG